MKKAYQGFVWGYGQRMLVELSLVFITLGVLVDLATEIMPIYIKKAKLVEPLSFAKDIQTRMMIDSALTGRWPNKSDIAVDVESWNNSIQDFNLNKSGNISILLHKDLGFKENNVLGFNLSVKGEGEAYRFYSWHCGESDPMPSLYAGQTINSTAPLIISHTICRNLQ